MVLDPAAIQAAIAAGEICAITLDTNVFDKNGRRLELGAFRHLRQFRGTDVRLVMHDVVVQEMQAHLKEDALEAETKLKAAIRSFALTHAKDNEWRTKTFEGARESLSAESIASRRIADFLAETGAELVPAGTGTTVERLHQDYFARRPPFGGGDKKAEFPDAIALHGLEAWAASHGTKMILVSNDGDWKAFAEPSDRLVVVASLTEALSLFHKHANIRAAAVALLEADGGLDIESPVAEALKLEVDGLSYSPDASAGYFFEADVYDAELKEVLFTRSAETGRLEMRAVEAGEDYVVLEMSATAKIDVTASFTFFIEDSVDKDSVPIGTADATSEAEVDVKVFVTIFHPELSPQIEGVEIQIPDRYHWVDFGDLGPDWSDD